MLVKRKGITISRQIMDDQMLHPGATGELTGLVNDLPIQERLFGDSNVIGIRVEIDRSRIVAHQQGFDDGLT